MTNEELRAIVRDAVARHLGAGVQAGAAPPPEAPPAHLTVPAHASHAIYLTVVNVDDACLIEPSMPCNHCHYCKSHGY